MAELFEKLAASPDDLATWFGQITGNPAVRSVALGAGGYYGSKWAYNALADKMVGGYLDQIKDPEIRKKEHEAYLERRDRIQPMISGTFAAIGAGLPLMHPMAQSQWVSQQPNATFADKIQPFFSNHYDSLSNMSKIHSEQPSFVKLAEYYMESGAPYASSADDMLLGKSFIMPGVRPLTFWNIQDIPKHQSIDILRTQIPIIGEDNTQFIAQAMQDAEDRRSSGMVSTGDIFKSLVRTGVGAGVGYTLANVLGTVMAQPSAVKSKMAHYGAIGGAVVNSGILGYGWDKMNDVLNSQVLGLGQNAVNEMLT
jgi:hypothetical protein